MERQVTSSSSSAYYLLRPKSLLLLLLFVAFSSLFLTLRHGRLLQLPTASVPLGANVSAAGIARAPVLEGGGVTRGGVGDPAAGDLSVIETNGAVFGGENGGTPARGEALAGQELAEAPSLSLGSSGSYAEAREAAADDGGGETLGNVSVSEMPSLAEGKNLSKEIHGSATETQLPAANASAEKLNGTRSLRPVNIFKEISGPAIGSRGESVQGGHVNGTRNSSVHGAYASQQREQLTEHNPGAAPVNPKKQDPDPTEGSVATKMNLARSDAAQCDVYDGSWVFDETYPLYSSNACPFIDEGFSCEANGRVDRNYMKWRWQPKHCNVSRFDAMKMLEMLRGKRLVFVGDSMNRNQWESMMCLLRTAIPDSARIRGTRRKGNYNFRFLDYNCSVEYHVTHFLVHESKAAIGQTRVNTLWVDTIDRSSSRWKGADVIVFNTAHWWSDHKTNAGVNYYQEGNHVHPYLDTYTAFQKALTTWALWVDRYINPQQTQVFFRSSSPSHFSGGEWNSGGNCRENTLAHNDSHVWPMPGINMMLAQVSKQMKNPVKILNITNLSSLRVDGHPSVYRRKAVTTSRVQDCSHWCLPGVPDTWNELLFYHLTSSQTM